VTTIAQVAVALATALTAASVVYHVALAPLPFPASERLVALSHTAPGINLPEVGQSAATYTEYKQRVTALSGIALWGAGLAVVAQDGGTTEQRTVLSVTPEFSSVLGVRLQAGSDIPAEPSTGCTVLLGEGYRRTHFSGVTAALGRALTIDGELCSVVGVLPPSFNFLDLDVDIVKPLRFAAGQLVVGNFRYNAVGRLGDAGLEDARVQLTTALAALPSKYPFTKGFSRAEYERARLTPTIELLKTKHIGAVAGLMRVVLIATVLVCVAALISTLHLTLLRDVRRHDRTVVAAILGATPRQLRMDAAWESALIVLASAGLGLATAAIALELLSAWPLTGLPRLSTVRLDRISLAVCAVYGLAVFLAIMAGHLWPRRGRLSLRSLSVNYRSATATPSAATAVALLLATATTLATVSFIVTVLLSRVMLSARTMDDGFQSDGVISVRMRIPERLRPDARATAVLIQESARSLQTLPGVENVMAVSALPFETVRQGDTLYVQGEAPERPAQLSQPARFKWVGGSLTAVLGIPVVAGRELTWSDSFSTSTSIAVSRSLATQLWGHPDRAVGQKLRNRTQSEWWTVVGVLGDTLDDGPFKAAPPVLYLPLLVPDLWNQRPYVQRAVAFALRPKHTAPVPTESEIRRALTSVTGPGAVIGSVKSVASLKNALTAKPMFANTVGILCSIVTCAVALLGLYGFVSSAVVARRREFAIRHALGSTPIGILLVACRRIALITAGGVVVGCLAAHSMWMYMSPTLIGGTVAVHRGTYSMAAAVMFVIVSVSIVSPAWWRLRLGSVNLNES
jgi:putative ABC transport system permease protein